MALPSWVYNQTSLPPWITGTAPPVRGNVPQTRGVPLTQPGIVGGVGSGRVLGAGSASRVLPQPRTPPPYQQPFGQPVVSSMQGQTPVRTEQMGTNTGMDGLLPRAPMPQFQEPSFESYGAEPAYEDDSSIYAGLGGPNPLSGQYGQLMQQLQGMMSQRGMTHTPFIPKEQVYSQSPELTNAIAMIKQLAESGGYSEDDKSELRARGVSPIRSVYANAQQGLDRSKSLQGGYSPGHTAATSKLARELSDRIAGQTTNVNADIADKVAQGKMAMAPQLGNITSRVNDAINEISGRNVASGNEAGMFNTKMDFDVNQANRGNQNTLMGMIQQLFGTGVDIAGRDADRNVNIAGLRQRGTENRNQFNMQNRELNQRGVESRNRNTLDLSGQRNQFNAGNRDSSQQMQQFMQRLGLDTRNANQGNEFNWAQLEQQGGLGLIQALMQGMR